jgi:predicted cupin superfamily sugar epimerase
METKSAAFYISHFNMQPHPEGGFYAIGYRSNEIIETKNGKRNLYSSVHFLVTKESPSRFHRLKSDEIWHLYDGSLTLHTISEKGDYTLTKMGDQENPVFQFRVNKNTWMAADTNDFALFGCTLSPSFEFEDFELSVKEILIKKFPKHSKIILRLS